MDAPRSPRPTESLYVIHPFRASVLQEASDQTYAARGGASFLSLSRLTGPRTPNYTQYVSNHLVSVDPTNECPDDDPAKLHAVQSFRV